MTALEILTGILKDVEKMAEQMERIRAAAVIGKYPLVESNAVGELGAYKKVQDLLHEQIRIARDTPRP